MRQSCSSGFERGADQAATAPRPRREEKRTEPLRFVIVERDRRLCGAVLVPDAEANLRVVAEVPRDTERSAGVALMSSKELDELAPLRLAAPWAEPEAGIDRLHAAPAPGHA